ncbi:MAG: hypothetical protein K8S55_11690 [Phycisphaerae bacterium]|nr:hypothetical protein [Phycisphaerae bacterium]
MAEKSRGIQNMWLLLIAVVLGILVVVIYNAHITAIRAEREGQYIKVLKVVRDLRPGERITAHHLGEEDMRRDIKTENYRKFVPVADRNRIVTQGKPVNQRVNKGALLEWDHITRTGKTSPSAKIGDNMVACDIQTDSNLGDLLSPDDTVNLLAVFPDEKGGSKTYRFLEGVRILNINGKGAAEYTGKSKNRQTKSRIRDISIELTRKESLKLANLLTHIQSDIEIELNKGGEGDDTSPAITDKALIKLTEKARTNIRKSKSRSRSGSR